MKSRGYLTVGVAGLILVLLDLAQRLVIAPLVKLRPSRRHRILGSWQRWIARVMIGTVRRVGGAQIEPLPRLPSREGTLIVMNHQSLLDIPIMVASLDDLYPRIVTRSRYARGKPLISHMTRLYQYPLVDPRATAREHMLGIEQAARTSPVPLGIFPEGTRTRDGQIGRFKRGGLSRILEARQWEVWLLVVDGFWEAARLEDFVASVSTVQGRVRRLGPYRSPPPGEPVDGFVEELREAMVGALAGMRAEGVEAPAAAGPEGT